MTRRRFITGMLVVATLLLAERAAAQDAPACDDQELLPAQVRCHLDAATRAGSAEPCTTAEDDTVRFNCISLYAEHNASPQACRLIGSREATEAFLQNACVAGVAVANRDPDICDQVHQPELADTCFIQLVHEHGGDVSLCQRVQDEDLRVACLELEQ